MSIQLFLSLIEVLGNGFDVCQHKKSALVCCGVHVVEVLGSNESSIVQIDAYHRVVSWSIIGVKDVAINHPLQEVN